MNRPFWLALWIIAIEAIVLLVLIPGDWTARIIEEEGHLLEKRLGDGERQWVHDTAKHWFDTTLIANGLYDSARDHLVPTDKQRERSMGLQDMGYDWFVWVDGRLWAVANAYYHILVRCAVLLSWLPYFLILLIPSVFDGLTTWRIKRTNFSYVSPWIHQYSTYGIVYGFLVMVTLFLAPIVLDPGIIPVSIMLACVMAGLMIGNLQKRL